ncbi:S-phase kinase-associated protein 2-like [Metopolophium dirhodum]|uniref:S-phase kinase-associated protein 2-like n=1 Tax=Metopolophium dirhodum TaxID=44670 RepID=UPI00298FF0D2|nr:S-phase kinase-associated protein 2-like [Metopolophium dirhodum]XP_060859792.1 S-phase kinase-associated protein 2-like [Metopolophium dirhodum]
MEDSQESTLKKNDVTDSESSSSNVEGYKDLGAYSLENTQVSKRSRYLYPDSKTWSMGPLNTYVYKHKQKKCLLNDNCVTFPEEILLKIFKMMDKRTLVTCTRVCHQWRRIAYDESLWQQLNIYSRSMSILTLDHLLARNIKYFSASHSNFYVFKNQYLCKTPFPKLQYLDLSSVIMDYKTLRSLLRQCSNLIKLSLENCSVDSFCCKYIGHNTNLKVLNLASTVGLNRNGLKHLMSLQNLEELNVAWAKLEDNSLQYLMANMIPNIKCLNISGFMYQMEDFDLSTMSSRCTKLIELDISDNRDITASSLDKILEKNHKLEVLTMHRCINIVAPSLLNAMKMISRKSISLMSLREINCIHIKPNQILGDEFNILHKILIPILDLKISNNMFSGISRSKLAHNEHIIWEIPAFIDS